MNPATMSEPPRQPDPVSKAAADWCVRLHFETCSEADRKAFLRWYQESEQHAREYALICRIWSVSEQLPQALPAAAPVQRRRMVPIMRAAAAVLVLGVCWAGGWSAGWLPGDARYYIAQDSRRPILLPDQSQVELNRHSSLLYLAYRHERRVQLHEGEAFFDVFSDARRPFLISTDNAEVRVTGTHFNVWSTVPTTTVTVSEGRVLVTPGSAADEPPVELTAGLQGRFSQKVVSRASRVDPAVAMAWRNDRLVFEATPLRDALPMMNRYLNIPLRLSDDALGDLRLGGAYKTTDLERLVSELPRILPVNITQRDGLRVVGMATASKSIAR